MSKINELRKLLQDDSVILTQIDISHVYSSLHKEMQVIFHTLVIGDGQKPMLFSVHANDREDDLQDVLLQIACIKESAYVASSDDFLHYRDSEFHIDKWYSLKNLLSGNALYNSLDCITKVIQLEGAFEPLPTSYASAVKELVIEAISLKRVQQAVPARQKKNVRVVQTRLPEYAKEESVAEDNTVEEPVEEETVEEETTEDVYEDIPEDIPDDISDEVIEEVSEVVSEEFSEEFSEEVSEEVSEEFSEEVSEEVSDGTPEELLIADTSDGLEAEYEAISAKIDKLFAMSQEDDSNYAEATSNIIESNTDLENTVEELADTSSNDTTDKPSFFKNREAVIAEVKAYTAQNNADSLSSLFKQDLAELKPIDEKFARLTDLFGEEL